MTFPGIPTKANIAQQPAPTVPPDFDIKQVYQAKSLSPNYSVLLTGEPGVGKTRLLGTSRLPLLVYSFDPKGVTVLHKVFPEFLKSGMIQYIPYWNEDYRAPSMYRKWERDWETHLSSGYLAQFGTVAIDSFTTWIEASANAWLEEKNKTRKGGIIDHLAQGDYPGLYNLTRNMIKRTSACNVDFILTAHLEPEENKLTGEIRYVLACYKGLKTIIPPLFAEKWVMGKRATAEGAEYSILTNNKGLYSASTQIGAGVFKREEEPDIKKLLENAGFSAKDKPAFWK